MRDARPRSVLPVIEAKPLKEGDLFGGGYYGSGLLDPTRTGSDPSRVASLKSQFGPNEDLAIELAAAFLPGPGGGRGGKFTGLGPQGRAFLEQLKTHDVTRGQTMAGDPVTAYTTKAQASNPIPAFRTDPMSKAFDPEVWHIASKLGFTRGKPFSELQEQIANRTPPGYDPAHFVSTVLGTATRNPGSSTLGGTLDEVRSAALRQMAPEQRAQFQKLMSSWLPWKNRQGMEMLNAEIARLEQTSGLSHMHDANVANQIADVIWNRDRHN